MSLQAQLRQIEEASSEIRKNTLRHIVEWLNEFNDTGQVWFVDGERLDYIEQRFELTEKGERDAVATTP